MQAIRQKLIQMKNEYNQILDSINEGLNQTMSEGVGELSLYDNHPGDIGTEIYEREKDMGTRVYLENQIKKVQDALDNIDKGTYGLCELCGKPIAKERLEAIPFTTMCVDCSQHYTEDEYNHYKRPVEEEILNPPYNAQDFDPNQTEIDGEDIWKKIAYFGTSETPSEIGEVDYKSMYSDYD